MEGVSLDFYKNNSIGREMNSYSEFHLYLGEDNNQYSPDTHAKIMNLYQRLMYKYIIQPNQSTVWEETHGCAKKYRCALVGYLIKIVS